MAIAPQFTATINSQVSQVSVANTARDGTGTLVDIFTPGANGSRVDQILISTTGTTTSGVIRLFYHDGTNSRLIKEILVSAIVPSTTLAAWADDILLSSEGYYKIETSHKLQASTNNAEVFNILAIGGDY